MQYEVRYEKKGLLGEGAYGSVYECVDNANNTIVAIKCIKMDRADEGVSSTTLRQLSILHTLSHQHIVKLLDQTILLESNNPRIELVFEFVAYDLAKVIKKAQGGMEEELAKKLLHQILLGVQYMHRKRVFHRDLKPQNILVSEEMDIKIADFGLGRIVNFPLHTMSKEIETLWYRAPQLLLGCCRYDFGVDMWSIGCIFYQMLQGKVLFKSESELGQIIEIFKQFGTPHKNQWPQAMNFPFFKGTFPKFSPKKELECKLSGAGLHLILALLKVNPQQRITIDEALNHDYWL